MIGLSQSFTKNECYATSLKLETTFQLHLAHGTLCGSTVGVHCEVSVEVMAASSEFGQLNRLSEEQQKAISDTKLSKEQWQKYRADYEKLRSKLSTLPDQLTHNVMVPFGPLAFMPGKLVHTNEITVLLGDDWFAERSAKQACSIVDRRIQAIDSQLNGLNEQFKLLDSRKDFTDQFLETSEEHGEIVEIREDFDEENEKKWREAHELNMSQYRYSQHLKQQVPSDAGSRLDDDFMRRLDELELMEQMEFDAVEKVDDKEDEEDDDDDLDGAGDDIARRRITFCHTPDSMLTFESTQSDDSSETMPRPAGANDTVTVLDQSSGGPVSPINSPADIYKLFRNVELPKSILKKSKSLDPEMLKSEDHAQKRVSVRFEESTFQIDVPGDVAQKPSWPSVAAPQVFTGEVRVRKVRKVVKAVSEGDVSEQKDAADESDVGRGRGRRVRRVGQTSGEEPNRVSQFKQQRMQMQTKRL